MQSSLQVGVLRSGIYSRVLQESWAMRAPSVVDGWVPFCLWRDVSFSLSVSWSSSGSVSKNSLYFMHLQPWVFCVRWNMNWASRRYFLASDRRQMNECQMYRYILKRCHGPDCLVWTRDTRQETEVVLETGMTCPQMNLDRLFVLQTSWKQLAHSANVASSG